jgi:Signal transduction histidine kinase
MISKNILIIDDTDLILNLIGKKIFALGYYSIKMNYWDDKLLDNVKIFDSALLIANIQNSNSAGSIEIIEAVNKIKKIPIIFILETEEENLTARLKKVHPDCIFTQPVFEEALYACIERSLKNSKPAESVPEETSKSKPQAAEKPIPDNKYRFGNLFDESPIPIFEEDYSGLKKYLDKLKRSGVDDFKQYFDNNPSELQKCADLIKTININTETIKFFKAESKEELVKKLPHLRFTKSYNEFKEEIIAFAGGKTNYDCELEFTDSLGLKRAIIVKVKVNPGYENTFKRVLISFFDITERKEAEESLKASLKEKDILLKEVHHRVKNNLQVISSLLNLQAEYIKDKEAKELFNDSLNRIRSMALIHERLYQSKSFSKINASDYIKDITNYLYRAYKAALKDVKISVKVDNINISIENAIPLGLIINEVVSNSFKFAFKGKEKGLVEVILAKDVKYEYTLLLKDNGIGLPQAVDFRKPKSLGLQLVNNLVEQLDGSIILDKSNGTQYTVRFTINEK